MRRLILAALALAAVVVAVALVIRAARQVEPEPTPAPAPSERGLFGGPWIRREPPGRVAGVLLTSGEPGLEAIEGTPVQSVVGGADGTRAIRDLLGDLDAGLSAALALGPTEVREAAARAGAALRARLDAGGRSVPVRALVLSWSDGLTFARSLPGFDRYDAIAVFDHASTPFDARREVSSADAESGTRLVVARFVRNDSRPGAGPAAGAVEVYELGSPVPSAGPQGAESEAVLRHVGIVREQFPGGAYPRPHGIVLTRDATVVSYGPNAPARRWTGLPRLSEDLRALLSQ